MIKPHPIFISPHNQNIKLWRYMDLSKYVDLILQQRLFFPKASLLGDPFENTTTIATIKDFEFALKNRHTDPAFQHYKDLTDEQIEYLSSQIRKAGASSDSLFVSCWHMNEYESAAMWKLYAKSDESICVVTDYSTLAAALPDCCLLGTVKYIDYQKHSIPPGNVLSLITHKRMSFEHEREIRAVMWQENLTGIISQADQPTPSTYDIPAAQEALKSINDYGASVPIDFDNLIKKVYVNPAASPYFFQTVSAITDRLGFKVPVVKSSLSEQPIK